MLAPLQAAASLIKAAACRWGCPVSSEMVNKAEMFCPHPEALKGRAEGDEDYYSVKKNKGLYIQAPVWGSSGELSSCSFLMCFSLPESNSFPGPRQLHINWPRRQCQDYSVQVLWRCHRQLNIDLEVCSYSLSIRPLHTLPSLHVISHLAAALLCLFFSARFRSLHARLFEFNFSFTGLTCVKLHCIDPFTSFFSPLHLLHLLDLFLSAQSPLPRVRHVSIHHSLLPFIRGFFKQPLAAGGRSLRQVLSRASAEVGLCRTRAGVARRTSALPFLSPLWGNKKA